MGENTVPYFHGTEKEQALLKQERFRVDFKGDFLGDTQYQSTYNPTLLLFGSVSLYVFACE